MCCVGCLRCLVELRRALVPCAAVRCAAASCFAMLRGAVFCGELCARAFASLSLFEVSCPLARSRTCLLDCLTCVFSIRAFAVRVPVGQAFGSRTFWAERPPPLSRFWETATGQLTNICGQESWSQFRRRARPARWRFSVGRGMWGELSALGIN